MASDTVYESCLPILKEETIEEEDKTDKLEELIAKETQLAGKLLETAVLDVLWRFKNEATPLLSSSPAVRHTVVRRNSPAPWQASRSSTPLGASPRSNAASPALTPAPLSGRPALFRMKSSTTASPFGSPKPSPRLGYTNPRTLQSPSLNSYESHENTSTSDVYGDYGSDNVDWLVGDDSASNVSSSYTGEPGEDWMSSQMVEMSPYDILRSILRDDRSDEDIEQILEANGYDLSASIASLMDTGPQALDSSQLAAGIPQQDKNFLIGKNMAPGARPVTPAGQTKSPIVCRYWLANGSCLRADCRFSHDLSNHICKYWMEGNCLAGDQCLFSHDPSLLVSNLSLQGQSNAMTPPVDANFRANDFISFPSLHVTEGQTSSPVLDSSLRNFFAANDKVAPPPGFSTRSGLAPEFIPSRPQSRSRPNSRPSSRHHSPGPGAQPGSFDDGEAFPSLGAAAAQRGPKKHHGKRGHGHGHNKDKEQTATTMADVLKKAPTPTATNTAPQSPRRSLRGRGAYGSSSQTSEWAQNIPAPQHIPWLETGDRANKAYLRARQEAVKHGGLRNKFLQSAAQAWNRNDVRAAKALSLRGQSENDLMRDAHRESARFLYDERNASNPFHTTGGQSQTGETYIDLHGLHPAEAVTYLSSALVKHRTTSAVQRDDAGDGKVLYAIVGTGHHSKNGRDKVGKAVRAYLNECRYAFREFSVPGDKGGQGGILGVDASRGDARPMQHATRHSMEAEQEDAEDEIDVSGKGGSPIMQHGKIRILKHEDVNR